MTAERAPIANVPLMRRLISLLTVLALGIAPEFSLADERAHRRQLDALQKQISTVQEAINNRRGEHRREQQALQEIEQAVATVHRNIAELEARNRQLFAELETLSEREAELFGAIAEQREHIGRDLANAYRLGRDEPLKLMLNLEDPHELSRSMRYYDYFLDARQQRIERFNDTLNELAEVRTSMGDRQQALEEQRQQMAAEESRLREQLALRQQTLASLQSDIAQHDGQLSELRTQQEELERLIRTIQEAITRLSPTEEQQPFAQRRGKLAWPTEGELRQPFGSRRSANMNWDGWLIQAEEGKPVRAVHGGRVVFSDYLRGHGLLIIVDHGDAYLSLYAHNQVLLKEIGEWIHAGEAIGRVGNSGGLERASLYFELRHRGRPTNPAPWFGPQS